MNEMSQYLALKITGEWTIHAMFQGSLVFELDFLEAFHIYKSHNNVVHGDFAIPPFFRLLKILH